MDAKRKSPAKSEACELATEQRVFAEVLKRNYQLQRGVGPLKPGVTHVVEKSPTTGIDKVVRKRFSAI